MGIRKLYGIVGSVDLTAFRGPAGANGTNGTIVTANPPGTDGANLERIAIAGANYNILQTSLSGVEYARAGQTTFVTLWVKQPTAPDDPPDIWGGADAGFTTSWPGFYADRASALAVVGATGRLWIVQGSAVENADGTYTNRPWSIRTEVGILYRGASGTWHDAPQVDADTHFSLLLASGDRSGAFPIGDANDDWIEILADTTFFPGAHDNVTRSFSDFWLTYHSIRIRAAMYFGDNTGGEADIVLRRPPQGWLTVTDENDDRVAGCMSCIMDDVTGLDVVMHDSDVGASQYLLPNALVPHVDNGPPRRVVWSMKFIKPTADDHVDKIRGFDYPTAAAYSRFTLQMWGRHQQ